MNYRKTTFLIVGWFWLFNLNYNDPTWWASILLVITFPLWPDLRDWYDRMIELGKIKKDEQSK